MRLIITLVQCRTDLNLGLFPTEALYWINFDIKTLETYFKEAPQLEGEINSGLKKLKDARVEVSNQSTVGRVLRRVHLKS